MQEKVIEKIKLFLPYLNESQRRLYIASEAKSLGRGGKRLIERELGISHNTINRGIAELASSVSSSDNAPSAKQRNKGGGRKKTITEDIWEQI